MREVFVKPQVLSDDHYVGSSWYRDAVFDVLMWKNGVSIPMDMDNTFWGFFLIPAQHLLKCP